MIQRAEYKDQKADVLPKYYYQKHSNISGSYSWDHDCDYPKARKIEKRTKYPF